jgi:hypothetical protein
MLLLLKRGKSDELCFVAYIVRVIWVVNGCYSGYYMGLHLKTPIAQALIEAKADVNATEVSCSRSCTISASLKSVQLIQTKQTRSKTPSYVVAFACELVALLCLLIIELYVYLLLRIFCWMATW